MKTIKTDYFQHLGIIGWQARQSCTRQANAIADKWTMLETAVKQCVRCELHQERTQIVFGVGNQQADLMIIGEAPGFHEDQQGQPFVGRAGQLLTSMLKTLGYQRKDVYIANILKCRPPNNRDPQVKEVENCTDYLQQQIALVQPRLLLAVGRIAAHYLLGVKSSLESLRSQMYAYKENKIPLIVTYHPAYLLRNPADKKKAFTDLQFVQQTLEEIKHGNLSQRSNETL